MFPTRRHFCPTLGDGRCGWGTTSLACNAECSSCRSIQPRRQTLLTSPWSMQQFRPPHRAGVELTALLERITVNMADNTGQEPLLDRFQVKVAFDFAFLSHLSEMQLQELKVPAPYIQCMSAFLAHVMSRLSRNTLRKIAHSSSHHSEPPANPAERQHDAS